MNRTLLILLLCSGAAACRPPPAEEPPVKPDPAKPQDEQVDQDEAEASLVETFTFEVGEAWNRHHKFGADGKRLYSTVTLLVYEGGKARIEDAGKLKLSTLDNTYGYESETTEWSNVWVGTWAIDGPVMAIDLELIARGCEKVVAGLQGTPEEKLECDEVPQEVALACKSGEIALDAVLTELAGGGSGGQEQVVDAWICNAAGKDVNLGGTPVAWVFGKGMCLEASSGPSFYNRSYGPCRENDPI